MGGCRSTQGGDWLETIQSEWEAASTLQRSRGCALIVSHEGLDPATGATRSVRFYSWTRSGTDGFLGHRRCQGVAGLLWVRPRQLLIQMGVWCGSDGKPNAADKPFTGPEKLSDTQKRRKTPGARPRVAGLFESVPYQSSVLKPWIRGEVSSTCCLLTGAC